MRMCELILHARSGRELGTTGRSLDFRGGEFYAHTLMTPMFVPAVKQYGAPRVTVAGVNPLMTGPRARSPTLRRARLHHRALSAQGDAASDERGSHGRPDARSSRSSCAARVFLVTRHDEQKFAASRDDVPRADRGSTRRRRRTVLLELGTVGAPLAGGRMT